MVSGDLMRITIFCEQTIDTYNAYLGSINSPLIYQMKELNNSLDTMEVVLNYTEVFTITGNDTRDRLFNNMILFMNMFDARSAYRFDTSDSQYLPTLDYISDGKNIECNRAVTALYSGWHDVMILLNTSSDIDNTDYRDSKMILQEAMASTAACMNELPLHLHDLKNTLDKYLIEIDTQMNAIMHIMEDISFENELSKYTDDADFLEGITSDYATGIYTKLEVAEIFTGSKISEIENNIETLIKLMAELLVSPLKTYINTLMWTIIDSYENILEKYRQTSIFYDATMTEETIREFDIWRDPDVNLYSSTILYYKYTDSTKQWSKRIDPDAFIKYYANDKVHTSIQGYVNKILKNIREEENSIDEQRDQFYNEISSAKEDMSTYIEDLQLNKQFMLYVFSVLFHTF